MTSQLRKKQKVAKNSGVLPKIRESQSVRLREEPWSTSDNTFKRTDNGFLQKKESPLPRIPGKLSKN